MEPALPGPVSTAQLERALGVLASFSAREELTFRISELEYGLATLTREQAAALLAAERVDGSILDAALTIKRLAGRINDIVHAVGIVTALPHVLGPGEVIESLSLGAGNTGRAYDLETDRQIAEFKFIPWGGGPESIRQNQLFIDLFNLATADSWPGDGVAATGRKRANWERAVSNPAECSARGLIGDATRVAGTNGCRKNPVMPGPVEAAVRAHVSPGARLPTPTGRAVFVVHDLGPTGLVLLLGAKQAWTPFSWTCLEGVPGFLRGCGWVRIGANRDVHNDAPTLDGYLKRCIKRQTADYMAVVLERAEVVELDREPPARLRLR